MFKKGAQVMQVANDYDINVFNGETGTIIDIQDERNVTIDFGGKIVEYTVSGDKEGKIGSLLDVELAYAMTVHKLQGDSVLKVIGVLDTSHYALLDRTLMYTMLTRTKDKCLLISSPKAFKLGVNKSKSNDRQTFLPTFKKRSKTPYKDPKKNVNIIGKESGCNSKEENIKW